MEEIELKKLIKTLGLLTFLGFLSNISVNAIDLTVGIYPYKEHEILYKEHKPLIEYLSKKLNINIDLKISKDYHSLIQMLNSNIVDIGLFGPYNYLKAKKIIPNIQYIATKQSFENNELQYSYKSVIVTLKKYNLHTIKEVKNKKFGFTDLNSTSGYLLPMIVLNNNNITKSDLKNFFMLKNHTRVMEALKSNSIEVAATYKSNYDLFVKKYGDIFNILYESQNIPNNAFFASPNLEKEFLKKITQALLSYTVEIDGQVINSYSQQELTIYDDIIEKTNLLE